MISISALSSVASTVFSQRGSARRQFIACLAVLGCLACTSSEEVQDARAGEAGGSHLQASVDTLIEDVDVGGHRLRVRRIGSGPAVVLIDGGFGDRWETWDGVVAALSGEAQVVQYQRAGYGDSEAGPFPRDIDHLVADLSALVDYLGLGGPRVLVGHSLGAWNALVLASLEPDRYSGVVLLDPPPLAFICGDRFPNLRAMADQATLGFRRDAERRRTEGDLRGATFFETLASEHDMMFQSTGRRVSAIETLGDLPLVVLGSGRPNPQFGDSAIAFQDFWRHSSETASRLSARGRFVFVSASTHDLAGDAPETVVGAIRECLSRTKSP